ncbi:hypothetical protein MAIT1_01041 [Magnetofaba australis IT-1]|uniref:Uncharacterized protein n=1 Tax=Magnetofaba australis IT-1 TaxID=1434232 RepID=A0A1Y2K3H1_9PROT|nr:hypothetical protein MAIT1_01041 [Magnetofaba australis IT-1]
MTASRRLETRYLAQVLAGSNVMAQLMGLNLDPQANCDPEESALWRLVEEIDQAANRSGLRQKRIGFGFSDFAEEEQAAGVDRHRFENVLSALRREADRALMQQAQRADARRAQEHVRHATEDIVRQAGLAILAQANQSAQATHSLLT